VSTYTGQTIKVHPHMSIGFTAQDEAVAQVPEGATQADAEILARMRREDLLHHVGLITAWLRALHPPAPPSPIVKPGGPLPPINGGRR